jgi:hypothetical protein
MKRWLAIPLAAIVAAIVGVSSYGNPTTNAGTTSAVSIDCDVATGGIQSNCPYAAGTTPVTVGVVFTNNSGASVVLQTFNFTVIHLNDALLFAPNNTNQLDGNPDFTADTTDLGDWACGPPNPDNDLLDPVPGAGSPGQESFLSCFNAVGSGPSIADGASLELGRVTYNVTGTGVEPLTLRDVGVADDTFTEIMSCNPVTTNPGTCNGATLQIGASAATNTPTNTPTATNTPAPTPTACVGASCPTATSQAFVTVTPTPAPGTPTAPAGATPPPGETPGAPGQPTAPGGTTGGGGGGGTITLPDTGSGGDQGSTLLGPNTLLLAAALGLAAMLSGGMWLSAAAAGRRGEDQA